MDRTKKYASTKLVGSNDLEALTDAAKHLREGEVVAFPTETVYGLGANAFDSKAVDSIFEAKGRPNDNPLIVHVATKEAIPELVSEITPLAQKLIDAFMPGPITVIMKKSDKLPSNVTAGMDTVGIRMPSSSVANKFLSLCECPVAAPSANLSGSPSPTKALHVQKDMDSYIYAIVDGGDSEYGLESTVVSAVGEFPVILRPGAITKSQIEEVANSESGEKTSVSGQEKPMAPGMKYRHYAPNACVEVVMAPVALELINDEDIALQEAEEFDVDSLSDEKSREVFDVSFPFITRAKELLKANPLVRIGVFSGYEVRAVFEKLEDKILLAHLHFYEYGKAMDVASASHCLFDGLRHLDNQKVDVILATGFDGQGLSKAYMNRLNKACGKQGQTTDSMPTKEELSNASLKSENFDEILTESVLFVSNRNSALSVCSEAVFRFLLDNNGPYNLESDTKVGVELYADSCGLTAGEGIKADSFMIEAVDKLINRNISGHLSKRACAYLYNENDLILTMRDEEAFEILQSFPELYGKVWSLSTYAASKGLVFKNEKGQVAAVSIPDPSGENYETYLHTATAIKAWLELLFPYILQDLKCERA